MLVRSCHGAFLSLYSILVTLVCTTVEPISFPGLMKLFYPVPALEKQFTERDGYSRCKYFINNSVFPCLYYTFLP